MKVKLDKAERALIGQCIREFRRPRLIKNIHGQLSYGALDRLRALVKVADKLGLTADGALKPEEED